jgi:cytochrome P450
LHAWPDPDRFDPDRFASGTEATRPRYAYFPFAGGLRGCIGEHFAMTEAIVAVAMLLGRYALRSDPARSG